MTSTEYQEISNDRLAATTGVVLLVRSVSAAALRRRDQGAGAPTAPPEWMTTADANPSRRRFSEWPLTRWLHGILLNWTSTRETRLCFFCGDACFAPDRKSCNLLRMERSN
jgi:hypothetical protein